MSTRNYGVPYMGSKNKIAERLFQKMPTAENFYDLFCGGCAMTHFAMEDGRFKNVHANDLDGCGLHLFLDAIHGKFSNERRWISREDFFRMKDSDPYVALCWSFGNNGRDYLYAKDIESYKRAAHYAITLDDWQPMRELMPEFADWAEPQMGGQKGARTRRFFFARLYDNWRGSHALTPPEARDDAQRSTIYVDFEIATYRRAEYACKYGEPCTPGTP